MIWAFVAGAVLLVISVVVKRADDRRTHFANVTHDPKEVDQ